MAVWNAAPYVEEAVDSILGQTEWHKVRRTGQSRVAVHEKAIIDSVRQSAERALARYVRGQDTEGYPTLRHRPILGLPLEDLRWTERRAYATTLYAWDAAVFARDRRLALSLYCIAKQLVLSCVIAGDSKTWLK